MMRFKLDENLPVEIAAILQANAHEVTTAQEESLNGSVDVDIARICIQEERVLITLDLDFADIRAYPPEEHAGFVVLRAHNQHRAVLGSMIRRLLPILETESPIRRLWIVDSHGLRIRPGVAEQ